MSYRNLLLVSFALASGLSTSGCGQGTKDPYNRQSYSGIVTLDGKPLAAGAITIVPSESGPVSSGANVKNGGFSVPKESGLPPGTYKVMISASEAGNSQNNPNVDVMVTAVEGKELIPARYNSQTTLTCEIRAGDPNNLKFELISQ